MLRWLIVLALVLLTAAPSASAATLRVTDFGDGLSTPGTLRNLVLTRAQAGDTIVFDRAATVTLASTLSIPPRLTQLTINGSVNGARAGIRGGTGSTSLLVHAHGVVVRDLLLQDISVGVRGLGASNPPTAVRIANNSFEGGRRALAVLDSTGTQVYGNQFLARGEPAVNLFTTHRTRIANNTFADPGGLQDELSDGLVVLDNTFDGADSTLRSRSALVRDNTFTGGRHIVHSDPAMRSVVESNTYTGSGTVAILLVARGAMQFVSNTVTGTGGQSLQATCYPSGTTPSSMLVQGNTFTQSGIRVSCQLQRAGARVIANTLRQSGGSGIWVRGGRDVLLRNNIVTGGREVGVRFGIGTSGHVVGGVIRSNAMAGLLAMRNSLVQMNATRFGGNGGAGNDLAPEGVTPNGALKTANANQDYPTGLRHDLQRRKLVGRTCAGCVVEVWEAEVGAEPGEGLRVVGRVVAGADGRFAYPAKGVIDCPDSGRLTTTATNKAKRVTSEFSPEVKCSCEVFAPFKINPSTVPTLGIRNFGATVDFPAGATPAEGVLGDLTTAKRPTADALGSVLTWEETQREVPIPDTFRRDYIVTVSNFSGSVVEGPNVIWYFRIPYEPPAGTNACGATINGTTDPV